MTAAVRARIDNDGLLLSADGVLLRLQESAGGVLGGPVVLPAVARLARLALRLASPIERSVLIADDVSEVRAHGRFLPDPGGVRIELVDWDQRAAPSVNPDDAMPPVPRRITPPGTIAWACDIRLRLVMVAADDAWGISDTAWLGRPMADLFLLIPDAETRFAILTGLAAQTRFANQSARMARGHADGTLMAVSGRPMHDEAGVFTGYVGEAAPVGFGRLPADIAADHGGSNLLGTIDTRNFSLRVDGALRRPLGRIIANAETIAGQLQGPIRPDYARYASDIALAGRHLLDLVDDLADLQAVERDSFTVASEAVDLADIARRAAGLLAMKAQERGVRIDSPGADERAVATGEFRRILQILLNLVGNAVRYGPEGGMVWLRVDDGETMVHLTVADQGPGLSAEQQARLFGKFERLGRTDAGGSGLGLYISRRLALAMGGDIGIDSAPGQGARFTLSLPRHPG